MKEKLHQLGWRVSPLTMAWLGAYVDYHFRDLTDMWGGRGPLNGQERRIELVRALFAEYKPRLVVETGTYLGGTSSWLARESGVTVHTVEVNPRYYFYAGYRLGKVSGLKRHRGDSRSFLERLAAGSRIPHSRVFFYLDAHDFGNMPLAEELEVIRRTWSDAIVLIDDFRVDDDPGYEFLEGFTRAMVPAGYGVFYPAAASADETGGKRGSVILGLGDAIRLLEWMPLLRPAIAGDLDGRVRRSSH